jgi:hypothetical protein
MIITKKNVQTLKQMGFDKTDSIAVASEDRIDKTILQSEMATSASTSLFSAILNILPNPEPLLANNSKRYDIYDEILNDSFIQGLVASRIGGTISHEWEIIKNKATTPEINLLQYNLEKLFDSNLWQDILMAQMFGIQFLEVVWNTSGSYWYADKIVAKPHDVFAFTSEGELRLLTKENMLTGIEVPAFKFLLPTNPTQRPTFNNYYGSSILAKSYWNVFIRKHEMDFWSVFSEDYGFPKIKGELKLDMIEKLKNELGMTIPQLLEQVKNSLSSLRQNGVLAHLEGLTISEVGGDKANQTNIFSGLIHETKMLDSVNILGHEGAAMSTPGELGGKPQAVKAMDWVIDNSNDLVEKTVNTYISWFHYLNFNSKEAPKIRLFEKDDEMKYSVRADVDIKLKQLGVEFNEDHFVDNYNLDKKYFTLGTAPEPVAPATNRDRIDNVLLRLHEVHPEISNEEAMEYVQMMYDDEEDNHV